MAALMVTLVGILYALVPEGRWLQRGKWMAAVRVALVGVVIGVTVSLLGFRLLAPSEAFPVTYRRGGPLIWMSAGSRGQAIRRALQDQLGLAVEDVHPFGLAGSADSTPLRIKVRGDPDRWLFGKLYARTHLRADRWYKFGRQLLYGRLEDEKVAPT